MNKVSDTPGVDSCDMGVKKKNPTNIRTRHTTAQTQTRKQGELVARKEGRNEGEKLWRKKAIKEGRKLYEK